jgi:GT2 family glycosyltransferase
VQFHIERTLNREGRYKFQATPNSPLVCFIMESLVSEDDPLVTLIVVHYGGHEYLRECVASMLAMDYGNFEVLVVDNGSSSDIASLDVMRDRRVKILPLPKNVGYAKACNLGSDLASGSIVGFLNNDIAVSRNWLSPLVSAFRIDPSIGAVQPRIVLKDRPEFLDAAGGVIDIFGCAHERRRSSAAVEAATEVLYAKGAAILVPLLLFRRLGKFDERFFLYYEETDFCWRVWLSGHRVMHIPTSTVYHARAASTSLVNLERKSELYSMARLNRSRMILKNYEVRYLLLLAPIILVNNLKDTLVLMLLGARLSAVLATLKAPWLSLKDLRTTLTKRYSARQFRKIPNRKLFGRIIMPKGPIFFPHELGDLPLKRRKMLEWIQDRSSKL